MKYYLREYGVMFAQHRVANVAIHFSDLNFVDSLEFHFTDKTWGEIMEPQLGGS